MSINVLLVSVDQMRRDCMGIYGNENIETPYLDSMASQGVLFNRAYSAVPTCIASRTAILTGLSQKSHGRVGYAENIDFNYPHSLPNELSKTGYQTECIGKMHVSPPRKLCGYHHVKLHDGYLHNTRKSNNEFEQSFEQVDDYIYEIRDKIGIKTDLIDNGLECNSWLARTWQYDEKYHPTNWVVDNCIDFFRTRDKSKPFFLHASFVRPHSPLDPPQFYFDMYKDTDIPSPYIGNWVEKNNLHRSYAIDCSEGMIPEKALKRARTAYYALITHIDHQIGRLLQSLGEYGIENNTVILFVSDHGDLLGDHNLFRKSLPYEGSSGVPLFIYDRGNVLNIPRGKVYNGVVELRDIMPTILDIAGTPAPETVEGKSLLKAIKENQTIREYLHGEHTSGHKSNHWIVTEKEKYIWFSQTGEEQFFDLENDPNELRNIVKTAERVKVLRELLINELKDRQEGFVQNGELLSGRSLVNTLDTIK